MGMMNKVLNIYRPKDRLDRKEFIVRLIIIAACYVAFFYACEAIWFEFNDFGVSYLVTQSVIGLLFWVAIALISVSRLRDISWPIGLVIIYVPIWLFGSGNLTIYDLVINNGKGLEGVWLLWLPLILSTMFWCMLAILILLPGKSNKSYLGPE